MIPKIRKILYATDLSKNSAYAFYFAVDLASKNDAKIIILHAIEPVPAYARIYGSLVEKAQQEQHEVFLAEIKSRLQRFCERTEGVDGKSCLASVADIRVCVGYPVEEILRTAEEEACDVLVLGSHGKGFLTQSFLGSVSRSVLDRTRKPVLIVPLPHDKADTEWSMP